MLVELSRSVTFLCQHTLLSYFQLGNHVVNSHTIFCLFFIIFTEKIEGSNSPDQNDRSKRPKENTAECGDGPLDHCLR